MQKKNKKDFSRIPSILIKRKTKRNAVKQQAKRKLDEDKTYSITPFELLAAALDEFMQKCSNTPPKTVAQYLQYMNEFQDYIMKNLNSLVGGKKGEHLLGRDFNEFISTFVCGMNILAKYRKIILDNGLAHLLDEDDPGRTTEQ